MVKSSVVKRVVLWSLASLIGIAILTATFVGLSAGVSAYKRAEKRATAQNQVRIARIEAQRALLVANAQIKVAQLVARSQITVAEAGAQAQYQQAVGIRRAQDQIKKGLTNPYLQYEAIQAQKAVATSGRNNTLIYLPSGSSGVPLVQDPQNLNPLRPR